MRARLSHSGRGARTGQALMVLAGALAALPACVAGVEPPVGDLIIGLCEPVDSDPDVEVSFDDDILPILTRDRKEAGCSCHDPADPTPAGFELTGLNLTSYSELRQGGVNTGGNIVITGDPCSSILPQKVGPAPPFGNRMPLGGPYLTDEEQQLIHDWIVEGARDN